MDLPRHLIESVENGNAILLLGSGASIAATDPNGKPPPSTSGLGKLLAAKFLTKEYENAPLTQIADYAISESSLFEVQDYILEIFAPFMPSLSHAAIPTFRWRALVTTNYDCLVEKAYEKHTSPIQSLVPLFSNTDRWDDVMRDYDSVPLLKLHGCVTRTHDVGCPLILSSEQYIQFDVGRNRLFRLFKELAAERPICYVGFSNNDPHIRSLVQQLDAEKVGRPHSFLVSPSVDEIAMRYWSPKHTTALKGTFEDFMRTLDSKVGKTFRGLRRSTPAGSLAISEKFAVSSNVLSEQCKKTLENDLDYVKGVVPEPSYDAIKFYSGVNQGWVAIAQELDVRRRLLDTLLGEYFLDDNPRKHRFVVVKAHAGAGKSVFLRRLAWEAAKEMNRLVLFANEDATLSSASVNEIVVATKEHVYLLVDDVLRHRIELEAFISGMGSAIDNITIIGGARTNEWNVVHPAFQALVTEEHFLPYLSDKELDLLISKLEQHKALKELERLPREERREQLRKKASRQLLVALHEATSGKRFEEILHDEYSRLTPNRAKIIYLAICFLNQFGIPVRAGLIARRFGITFEEFGVNLFRPLEEVVITTPARNGGDHCYAARHPHVAEMVVANELRNVEDLFGEYLEAITNLNIGYSTDKQVFRILANGKKIASSFPEPSMGYRIFEVAVGAINEDDAYLYQQQALFEMYRESGNLGKATEHLNRAIEIAPKSRIIKHTFAELHLRKSEIARTALEKEHSLRQAESICRGLLRDASDSYAHSTIVKAGIQRLRQIVGNEELLATQDVEGLIKGIESNLEEGLQRFPGDAFLLAQEAELAKLLCESDRVTRAFKLSFQKNPRNAHVALQLASIAEEKSDLAEAQRVLRTALDANSSNQRLHFAYGKFLLCHNIGTINDQIYHFRHSFTPLDQNYEAQLMYGRQLFIAGRFEDSKDVFSELKQARLPNSVRRRQTLPLMDYFTGTVIRNEAWFCLIERDGDRAKVRFDEDDSGETDWTDISRYAKVRFRIAFTMYGPEAFDVTIL